MAYPQLNGGSLADEQSIARFLVEARAVGAGTVRTTPDALATTVAGLLQGPASVVVGVGLHEVGEELLRQGFRVFSEDGDGGAAAALPQADVGICRALLGVAASGTLLIGPGSGLEGATALLPPHHVAILHACDLLPDLSAALIEAASLLAAAGARLTFITGPSRTSDIELTPVVGVHGPLRVDIVIVDG